MTGRQHQQGAGQHPSERAIEQLTEQATGRAPEHLPDPNDGRVHRARLTEEWLDAVCGGLAGSLTRAELRALLADLTERLAAQLTAESFDPEVGTAAGQALVTARLTTPEVLSGTVAVLGRRLLPAAGTAPTPEALHRLTQLQGAFAAGHVTAVNRRTVADQEAVRRSMLSARVAASRALQSSQARFRGVFDSAAIGIAVSDPDGILLEVNRSLGGMLGHGGEELLGAELHAFAHPEDAGDVRAALRDLVRGRQEHVQADKRFRRGDGQLVWTHLTMSLVRDPLGSPQHVLVLMEDVTDRHRLHARLAHQATHDPLTGLPNRARLAERLREVFRTPEPGARFGLCCLDLDGFKVVNDTAGHDAGDELLTRVARRLHDALAGPGRLVARLGGDEFVVLMEHTAGPADAEWVARTALQAARTSFTRGGHELRITASAGVVERPVGAGDAADAMRAADMTLYWAKAAGKDRWSMFDAQRDARQIAGYRLGGQLPGALERGEFFVLYQPIVRLGDRRPVSAEALVRWRHPEHGVLAPADFIHLAEDTGMIVELGRWVLEEACRQAELWWRRDPAGAPAVSVNLSARQCAEEDLPARVAKVLSDTGLPAGRLQLELTESAVMPGGRPLAALWDLAEAGVRVALDDFGTGYSNLSYLRTLPVTGLKIDRSFIQGLGTGRPAPGPSGAPEVQERIVAALTQLARAMDLVVTAEGVETPAQAELLTRLGADLGQGLLFGGPGPAGPRGPLDSARLPEALHIGEQAEQHGRA